MAMGQLWAHVPAYRVSVKDICEENEDKKKSVFKKKTKDPDQINAEIEIKHKPVKSVKESVKHLSNLKNILQYSNATLFRGKDCDEYKCNFCMKKYKLPKDLKAHFLQEHNDFQAIKLPKVFQYVLKIDITELTCKICEKTFDKLENFTDHLQKEHAKTFYTDIANQMIPFKFDSENLRCAICTTEFTNYKILLEHMHVHFRNFVCDTCNSGFVTKQLLARHKRRHADDKFKCDLCDKIFNCEQKKRDHEQRIHLGIKKRNKCHFCEEKFADYWNKMNHMIKEHGAPPIVLKCQACERSFSNKRALTRHVKEDHLMERKHVCSICGMKFFLRCRMKDHMAVHTGDKRFQCHVCTRWYMTRKSLLQHLRSHADDRKFMCAQCPQAFVHQNSLDSHMKTKHGDSSTSLRSSLESSRKKRKNLSISTSESILIEESINGDTSEAEYIYLGETKTKTATLVQLKEVDKHLKNIREVLLNSNATPIRCYGGKGYACNFCSSQYLDPADLKEHTINKHDDKEMKQFMAGKDMHGYFVKLDITGLKCKLCDQKIDTLETLMQHLSEIHKVYLYMDIKNHILPFKFDSECISCFICSNIFNSFKALLEHVNVHYRNYICEVCDAGFVNKNILLRHGYAHKTGTFACTDCPQVFDTARKRKFHVRSKHKNYFPHKCAYCSERFKEIWKKKNHMKQAHDIKGPGVKCKACEKQFATKQGWRLHTARVHLMLRNHKCNDCDMEFHTKQELALHEVKHTGTREFRCDVCFKKYGRYKTMREHRRRNHPEIPA